MYFLQAAQNLIVLARENAGAQSIYNHSGVPQLIKLMEGKDAFLQLCAIRTLACMCLHNKQLVSLIFGLIREWTFHVCGKQKKNIYNANSKAEINLCTDYEAI